MIISALAILIACFSIALSCYNIHNLRQRAKRSGYRLTTVPPICRNLNCGCDCHSWGNINYNMPLPRFCRKCGE